MASKCLVNDVSATVTDSIDGYLYTRSDLARLDGYPGAKVIVRKHIDADKVRISFG